MLKTGWKIEQFSKSIRSDMNVTSLRCPYGTEKVATFLSERMDFENCVLFHPVYQNDYSSWCLK